MWAVAAADHRGDAGPSRSGQPVLISKRDERERDLATERKARRRKPWRHISRLKNRYGVRWNDRFSIGDDDPFIGYATHFASLVDALRAFATEHGPIADASQEMPRAVGGSAKGYARVRKRTIDAIVKAIEKDGPASVQRAVEMSIVNLQSTIDMILRDPIGIDQELHIDTEANYADDLLFVRELITFYNDPADYMNRVAVGTDERSFVGLFKRWGIHAFLNRNAREAFASFETKLQAQIIREIREAPAPLKFSERGTDKKPRRRRVDSLETKLEIDDELDSIAEEGREDSVPASKGIRRVAQRRNLSVAAAKQRYYRATRQPKK